MSPSCTLISCNTHYPPIHWIAVNLDTQLHMSTPECLSAGFNSTVWSWPLPRFASSILSNGRVWFLSLFENAIPERLIRRMIPNVSIYASFSDNHASSNRHGLFVLPCEIILASKNPNWWSLSTIVVQIWDFSSWRFTEDLFSQHSLFDNSCNDYHRFLHFIKWSCWFHQLGTKRICRFMGNTCTVWCE